VAVSTDSEIDHRQCARFAAVGNPYSCVPLASRGLTWAETGVSNLYDTTAHVRYYGVLESEDAAGRDRASADQEVTQHAVRQHLETNKLGRTAKWL
jgi:hypothetical protein